MRFAADKINMNFLDFGNREFKGPSESVRQLKYFAEQEN